MQTFWLNVLGQQLDTGRIRSERKLNIVSLFEFYNNYLTSKKYKQMLILNVTFCKYVSMYLHIGEAIFKNKIYKK